MLVAKSLLFSRTGLSSLLNKIFEVVPCLILGLLKQFLIKVCINYSSVFQGGGWVGRGEVGVGWGLRREEEKPSQVKETWCVDIAIEYKLGQKYEFKFLCKLG